jgi:drug/metabolite transporter (DMT)-like permease
MPSIDESAAATKPHSHPTLAVLSLLYAATMWGLMWYPLRLLETHGLHGLWSTLLIYCGTLLSALWLMQGRYAELRRAPWLLLGIGLASGWTNTAFILAVLDGNVVRVLLLFYLSPLWATLLGWWWLGETIRPRTVAVLVIALLGAIIMLWSPASPLPWPQDRADWLALSAGMGFAVLNVMVRQLQNVSVQTKTVIGWLGVIVFAGFLIVMTGQPLGSVSAVTIAAALLFGAVVLVNMSLAVVYGVTHMPVQRSAVILLFEIVAGAVSAQWLTDEVVTNRQWLGGALVVLAAWLSARPQAETGASA